jgi:nitroimidazol reductase NimA-like FMN-containing flavoprotein (pyridoxamine 5'-phosphate oxidase superfamily)
MRIKKNVAAFIEWERVCRIGTVGKSGVPHVVPVCHVFSGGKIYFASERGARKLDNLRVNPRVTVTVDSYSDVWADLKGVMVQGTARVVERGPRFKKLRALLYRKYPQYPQESAIGERDSVIVEVSPKRVLPWGFE